MPTWSNMNLLPARDITQSQKGRKSTVQAKVRPRQSMAMAKDKPAGLGSAFRPLSFPLTFIFYGSLAPAAKPINLRDCLQFVEPPKKLGFRFFPLKPKTKPGPDRPQRPKTTPGQDGFVARPPVAAGRPPAAPRPPSALSPSKRNL